MKKVSAIYICYRFFYKQIYNGSVFMKPSVAAIPDLINKHTFIRM